MTKLTIETVSNGYLINVVNGDEESIYVFSAVDGENECVVDLLKFIQHELGHSGSKHDEERIFVRLEKQNDS